MVKQARDTSGWEPPTCAWCGWTDSDCICGEAGPSLSLCEGCETHYWEDEQPGWICDAPQEQIDEHARAQRRLKWIKKQDLIGFYDSKVRTTYEGYSFIITPFGGFMDVQKATTYEPPVTNGGPLKLYELAAGVKGYAMRNDEGLVYIPMIEATQPGEGDVGRFLDSLSPKCRIPNVINKKLMMMILRRKWTSYEEWAESHGEMVTVWRPPT